MRFLSWLITLPLTVAAVLFALSNRDAVTLKLWPLPFETVAPMYLAILLSVVVGVILGGFVTWNSARANRIAGRGYRARSEELSRDLRAAEERISRLERNLAEATRPRNQRPANAPLPLPTDPAALTAGSGRQSLPATVH